jgi:hypothetical protein
MAQLIKAAYVDGEKDPVTGVLSAKPGSPYFRLWVTDASLTRAVAVLSKLAWALESRGMALKEFEEEDRNRTEIQLIRVASMTELCCSLSELTKRFERERPVGRPYHEKWGYRPTGRLRFVLHERDPERERKVWTDGKYQRLEDMVPEIVEGCVICAEAAFEREQKCEAEWRANDEREQLRKAAEARQAAPKVRRDRFRKEASQWAEAQRLREFRTACEAKLRASGADGSLTPDEIQWLRWADDFIAEIDPLARNFLPEEVAKYAEWVKPPATNGVETTP